MAELVSIVILNWNGLQDTIECLQSLKELDYPDNEIIVVDNGSKDGTCDYLKVNYPYIKLVENDRNIGVAEGNNCGIKLAKGKYVLLLNNDVVVDPGFLKELVDVAESDESVGAVGAIIYYYNDPKRIWSAGGLIRWNRGKIKLLGFNQIDNDQFSKVMEVSYAPSCALLIKRELFKVVGYMDPDYFAYFDETDWCVRSKRAGYKIMCAPKSKVWHKVSATAKKTSGLYTYLFTRNRFWFMRKLASPSQLLAFLLIFSFMDFWISIGLFLTYYRDIGSLLPYYRGIRDGLSMSKAGIYRYINY